MCAAALFYTALALVLTFPLVLHVTSSLPQDLGDPLLSTSILWWNAHVLPLSHRWWDGFAFAPAPGMLAFSDHRLGLSLLASPLQWLGCSPVTCYNIAFLSTFPLCALAAHALGFTLTHRHDAALIAGVAYGFNPFRVAHLSHLELLAAFAMPVALAALHLFVRERRPRWIALFAVALVVQGLCATYYLLFFLVLLALWIAWFVRPWEWRIALSIGTACVVAGVALLPIAIGFARVHEFYGFTRLLSEVTYYSADLRSFVSASPLLRVWGFTSAIDGNGERQIFPGLTIVLLAAIGAAVALRRAPRNDNRWRRTSLALIAASYVCTTIAISFEVAGPWRWHLGPVLLRVTDAYKPTTLAVLALAFAIALHPSMREGWRRRSLLLFYVAATACLFLLAMGPAPTFFGAQILYRPPYEWLMRLPAFANVRAPARFAMVAMLTLSAAAALGFNRLRLSGNRRTALAALAVAGVLADGWIRPLTLQALPTLWPMPSHYAFGSVLELPLADDDSDFIAMYRGTLHGHPVVNGNSGFIPIHYSALQLALNEGNTAVFDAFTRTDPLLVVIDKRRDPDEHWRRSVRAFPRAQPLVDDDRWAIFGIARQARPPACEGTDLDIARVTGPHGDINLAALRDGNLATWWQTPRPQLLDDALVVDLGRPAHLCAIEMSIGEQWNLYPRDLDVTTSADGRTWTRRFKGSTAPLAVEGAIRSPRNIWLTAPLGGADARFIRLRLDAPHLTAVWLIAELRVAGARREELAAAQSPSTE